MSVRTIDLKLEIVYLKMVSATRSLLFHISCYLISQCLICYVYNPRCFHFLCWSYQGCWKGQSIWPIIMMFTRCREWERLNIYPGHYNYFILDRILQIVQSRGNQHHNKWTPCEKMREDLLMRRTDPTGLNHESSQNRRVNHPHKQYS